jgi:hypothetical protein
VISLDRVWTLVHRRRLRVAKKAADIESGPGSCLSSFLLPLAGLIGEPALARDEQPCERRTVALSVSPDDTWVALVAEGTCSSGLVTVSTDTVRLVSRDSLDAVSLASRSEKAEFENDVLVVDDYGRLKFRPLLQWLSPRKLQLMIPNISAIGLQKSSYRDVEIVIRYEPDDPAAREKWKERGVVAK